MPEPTSPFPDFPKPYRSRSNGDLITAEDWNEIQILGRQESFGRDAELFEASQAGTPTQEDGLWVINSEALDSGETWTELPGLVLDLDLQWPTLVSVSARGRAEYTLYMAVWIKDANDNEAPARVSVGLAAKAEVPDYATLPWAQQVKAWTDKVKPLATAKALNGRTLFATGATVWLSDTFPLPKGKYELTLRAANKGTATNLIFQAITNPSRILS